MVPPRLVCDLRSFRPVSRKRHAGVSASGVTWKAARARGSSSPPPPLLAALGGGERVEPVVPFAGHFRVAVVEWGSTSHLSLSGEFDIAGLAVSKTLSTASSELPRPRQVLFDLRGLTFLDAAGLRTILRATSAQGPRPLSYASCGREARRTASSPSRAPVRSSAWSTTQQAWHEHQHAIKEPASLGSSRPWAIGSGADMSRARRRRHERLRGGRAAELTQRTCLQPGRRRGPLLAKAVLGQPRP